MLLYYLRHGDPIYDPDSLTELGKRQAEALARRLAVYGMDEIYSSTSQRAYDTAKPLAEILKKDITKLAWANESYDYMEFSVVDEKGSRHWFDALPGSNKLFHSDRITGMGYEWYNAPEFAGTQYKSGFERISRETDAFFEKLGYKHDHENHGYIPVAPNEKRIAFFAHGGFGAAFLSCLLDIPYPWLVTRTGLSHSSMTVIHFAEQDEGLVFPAVLQLSSDSHIYREGLPTNYNNLIYV